MTRLASENWKAVALRGAITLLLGVVFLVRPQLLIQLLIVGFGGYGVINGLIVLIAALEAHRRPYLRFWWTRLVQGVVSIAVGLALLVWPGATLLALRVILALWAISTGALELLAAVRFRSRLRGNGEAALVDVGWLQGLSGVLTLLFGLVLLPWPEVTADIVYWVIVGYTLLEGSSLLALAWPLRRLASPAQG